MNDLTNDVNVEVLVQHFMEEYKAKVDEVELPEANRWVDDVLLPEYTSGMDTERSESFVKALSPVLQAFLLEEYKDPENALEGVTEDV